MKEKLFSSALIILIVVFGGIVTGVGWIDVVRASTEVAGIIGSDTTWTPANSPYSFTMPVLVAEGVTLTIQPGVTVNFNSYYLRVNGTLRAIGSNSNKIVFNMNNLATIPPASAIEFKSSGRSWDEQTQSGSIIENAVINSAWATTDGTIYIESVSPKINNNVITNIINGELRPAITGYSATSAIISNNTISGDILINGGTFYTNTLLGELSSGGLIINNTIRNPGGYGIRMGGNGTSASGNTVSGCNMGVEDNGPGLLQGNLIYNNNIGVQIGIGIIKNNTIAKNSVGLELTPFFNQLGTAQLLYNNIYSTQYNLKMQGVRVTTDIDLPNNWWGTNNTQAINQTIFDFKYDFNLRTVNFVPFLNEMNLQAPQPPTYTTAASAGPGGSISPMGNISVTYGSSLTFNVTANPGHQIASVLVDGRPASTPYTFTNVVTDHTIAATFKIILPIPDDGIINTNTTWSKTDSPYIFTGDITVAPGVTLTINPGVTVDFNSSSLIINGTLQAKGNETNRIKFQSSQPIMGAWPPRIYFAPSSAQWNETTDTGCIIEYAEFNVTNFQYETILGGSPRISNNLIYNYGNDAAAVRINGLVLNNTILGGWYGIVAENGTILQNIIKDAYGGIICGFISVDPLYHPTIIGNLLMNNSAGIIVSSCSPYIANNTIVNNTYGIRFDSYAFYRSNALKAIIYNNIYNNNHSVLVEYTDPQISINMTYNWWGTNDVATINQTIYDYEDNSRLSRVNFAPFLTSPNPQAPSVATFTITASAGTGGSISPNGTITVIYGGNQTFNITPNPGYQISNVTIDDKPATAPYFFNNVIADHTISATFQQIIIPEIFPSWIILIMLVVATIIGTATLKRKTKNQR